MKEDIKWAEETLKSIAQKMKMVAERSKDKIPYTTENGIHDDWSQNDKIGWWTNGFWGGLMWQLYAATGEDIVKIMMYLESLIIQFDLV